MPYQFFAIPAINSEPSSAALNQFCASHSVISIDKQFIANAENSYWAICVTWVEKIAQGQAKPGRSQRVDYKEVLNEADFTIFAELRELRKNLAARDGVPVYNVFTNEQLATMVQLAVVNKTALQNITGIGKTRLENYAEPFLQALINYKNNAQA
jgi:superfamily II DNA helicase RecQ